MSYNGNAKAMHLQSTPPSKIDWRWIDDFQYPKNNQSLDSSKEESIQTNMSDKSLKHISLKNRPDSLERYPSTSSSLKHLPDIKSNPQKPPVWERLFQEAFMRKKKQQAKHERHAFEKHITSKTVQNHWKVEDWNTKWKQMMERYQNMKQERERIHSHMEFQQFLEEDKECTFRPRCSNSTVSGHEKSDDMKMTLKEMELKQKQCIEELKKCDKEEAAVDLNFKTKFLECLKNHFANPSSNLKSNQRYLLENAAEQLRKNVQCAYTNFMERRMNILHECTVVHNLHYQWRHVHGINAQDASFKTDFDTELVDTLRNSHWYHVGKKKYPSMKTYATIKSALHAYTDTLCSSELSCTPQTPYSKNISRENKLTVTKTENTLHRSPLDAYHTFVNDRLEKATELKPNVVPSTGNISETAHGCTQTTQEVCYSKYQVPLAKDQTLKNYCPATEQKTTPLSNFTHSSYKTNENASPQRSGTLVPRSLETKHIPTYPPTYSSLREITNVQQVPNTSKPAYYQQLNRFSNMPQTTTFHNQKKPCSSIVTQNHPKQKTITNGFWSNVAQHFFPLK